MSASKDEVAACSPCVMCEVGLSSVSAVSVNAAVFCFCIQVEIEKKRIKIDGEDPDKAGDCVTQ